MAKNEKTAPKSNSFPPVVTVLGHVDHGKTTLLDAIRKTSVASREIGGITQKIGASTVFIKHENQLRKITFLDTPGHEAFTKMRSRGTNVADIGLLIISAADGLMPQTKESIAILKEAKIPFIVVITKIDLEASNVERVKQQLLKEEVLLEGYGGDMPVIEVSAKTNHNIQALLDLILLVFDLRGVREGVGPDASLEAVVIESRLDPKVGPKASVIVKNGTISVRDEISSEGVSGKIRSLITDQGEMVKSATVGEAVEVLGFDIVPPVGFILTHKHQAQLSGQEVEQVPLKREVAYTLEAEEAALSIILVADTQGSLEAILNALPKEVKIVMRKTGEVSENDILIAKSTGSLVLSFSSRIRPDVAKLAMVEKVLAKNYTIIYEMLDEIEDVLEGKKLAGVEQILGKAKILAFFPFNKTTVLGVTISEGRMAKGDKVRIERDEKTVGEATIASLRSGKNPISKVEHGREAGIILNNALDFQVGDVIISHS